MKQSHPPYAPFTKTKCPDWRCPSCLNQSLKIMRNTFKRIATAKTRGFDDSDDLYLEEVKFVFSCILVCRRDECAEHVSVSGYGYRVWSKEDYGFSELFIARSFTPPLPLFLLPEGCLPGIMQQMNVISSLLTVNNAATANAIRRLLEILMDVMEIPESHNLHQRIEKGLPVFGEDHSAAIHALKAIGNAGSHGNDITHQDLEDACLVLEAIVKKFCLVSPDLSDIVHRFNTAFNKRK